MMFRRAAIATALLICAQPAGATVRDGVAKWQAGDYRGAVAEWLPFAARGDPDAQFNLGQAYKLGRGVAADPKISTDYFRKAAANGHLPAMERLGLALYDSAATRTEALRWLGQAAKYDQPRALYVMGVAAFNGDGVPKDWPMAYGYMTRAAAKGVPQAKAALDTMNANVTVGDRAKGDAIAAQLAATRPERVEVAVPSVKSATRAAAAISAPAPAAAPGAGWRVQVGAYADRPTAEAAWKTLKSSQAALLADIVPTYQQAGAFQRLQLGPFAARDAARALCAKLTAAGRACFVVPAS